MPFKPFLLLFTLNFCLGIEVILFKDEFHKCSPTTYSGPLIANSIPGCPRWSVELLDPLSRLRVPSPINRLNGSSPGGVTLDLESNDSNGFGTDRLIWTLDLAPSPDNPRRGFTYNLAFSFMSHGETPDPEDKVQARGSQNDQFFDIYPVGDLLTGAPGLWFESGIIPLDFASMNQSVSHTVQIMFNLRTSASAISNTTHQGLTIDGIVLSYTAQMATTKCGCGKGRTYAHEFDCFTGLAGTNTAFVTECYFYWTVLDDSFEFGMEVTRTGGWTAGYLSFGPETGIMMEGMDGWMVDSTGASCDWYSAGPGPTTCDTNHLILTQFFTDGSTYSLIEFDRVWDTKEGTNDWVFDCANLQSGTRFGFAAHQTGSVAVKEMHTFTARQVNLVLGLPPGGCPSTPTTTTTVTLPCQPLFQQNFNSGFSGFSFFTGELDSLLTQVAPPSFWTLAQFGNQYEPAAMVKYATVGTKWMVSDPIYLNGVDDHFLQFKLLITESMSTSTSNLSPSDIFRVVVGHDIAGYDIFYTPNTILNVTSNVTLLTQGSTFLLNLSGFSLTMPNLRIGFFGKRVQNSSSLDLFVDDVVVTSCPFGTSSSTPQTSASASASTSTTPLTASSSTSQSDTSCPTCSSLGFECNIWPKSPCPGFLDCGNCPNFTRSTCTSNGECKCTPATCKELQKTCGNTSDLCGGTLDCGNCSSPDHNCTEDGVCVNQNCTDYATCSSSRMRCGLLELDCDNVTALCGICRVNFECTGFVCACSPDQCFQSQCGIWSNGCGGKVECGECSEDEICSLDTRSCEKTGSAELSESSGLGLPFLIALIAAIICVLLCCIGIGSLLALKRRKSSSDQEHFELNPVREIGHTKIGEEYYQLSKVTHQEALELFKATGYLIIVPKDQKKVKHVIGAGNFGTIKVAQRIKDKQFVASKKVKGTENMQKSEAEANMQKEAAGPGVLPIFHTIKLDDSLFHFMPLAGFGNGKDVQDHILTLNDPRLALEVITFVAYDILRGLKTIHSKDIFHLDIKPENVVLTQDGQAFITDFGCAKKVISQQVFWDSIGDTRYFSPQRFQSCFQKTEFNGEMADLWAAGMMLLQMIKGADPVNLFHIPPQFAQRSQECNESFFSKQLDQIQELIAPEQGSIWWVMKSLLQPNVDQRPHAARVLPSRCFASINKSAESFNKLKLAKLQNEASLPNKDVDLKNYDQVVYSLEGPERTSKDSYFNQRYYNSNEHRQYYNNTQ